MGKKTKPIMFKDDKQAFIQAYRNNMCDISRACKAMRMSRQTYYNWLNADPAFALAIREAKEDEKDWWESQLKILARGVPKLDDDGKLIGWRVQPSEAAVIFGNKTINRDRGYDQRIDIHHTVSNEPQIDLSMLTKAERQQWYKLLEKATIKPKAIGGNGKGTANDAILK